MAEAGREITGSVHAPHIGSIFEGSRMRARVMDVLGRISVEELDITDRTEREVWAFRNINAFTEYTSPLVIHWYQAAQDWTFDIRTATEAALKKRGTPPELREQSRRAERLMKAMIGVTASARAMENSAGSLDAYVGNLVGDNPDRADTWAEFLVHKDPEKLDLLKRTPLVRFFWNKLNADAFNCQRNPTGSLVKVCERDPQGNLRGRHGGDFQELGPNPASKLAYYLSGKRGGYKGGMREYIYDYLLQETAEDTIMIGSLLNGDKDAYVELFGVETEADLMTLLGVNTTAELDDLLTGPQPLGLIFADTEAKAAAAKLAADIFLIDEYTKWEFDIGLANPDLAKLKPTENWGGNPLRAVIEPSFLPRTVKHVYGEDKQILDWVDQAFTFDFETPNLPDAQKRELEQLKESFKKNSPLKPTMTSPLKALNRYGQALMTLFGGSTAPGLPVLNDRVFSGKESITNIWELMNQVVGDVEGKKSEEWPFGKDVMGWFTARILYIKAVAAVRQFLTPGTLGLVFSPEDQRNLRKVAEIIFGNRLRGEAGILRETASDRIGFRYRTSRIPGIAEVVEQTKNILLLGGEHGKEEAYLKRFFQVTFGVAAAISGGGGRRK